ncbi:class I SAM-dependent methyltransferase [Paenibacillus validus]|uniref:class I SAM-dependent methyltransferase n=1 Tax=Paenibacillus TaxID=44249 RepID=UPI000FDA665F|nr:MULTISPECIES: class I SAM-dependent methyltransferase [Paenibacillus]MED4603786.1 class I SAM-dependent methyltransferase [Paenibacillus validus]MED4609154.1 class I SAM-dependent methyltransferase [Paenibacillus validus]
MTGMPDHDHIYTNEAAQYDLLISREDCRHNIMETFRRLLPNLEHLDVADIGAGTGRLSCLLAPYVQSVVAIDASQAMLDIAADKLKRTGLTNWETCVADNRRLPLPDHSVDVVTAGWTICYSANSKVDRWNVHLETILAQIQRILRPSGTAIIMENFGTGDEQPNPPDFLTSYFHALETEYGFSHAWIRTDYRFTSVDEAERLSRFFFGPDIADKVSAANLQTVPECTGVWWKRV